MSRYQGINCPICEKPLQEQDEVVVCPDCGAPYHRQCYLEKGSCQFSHLHETGEQWQPPHFEPKEDTSGHICSRCGTKNPTDSIFCQVCGMPLSDQAGFGQTSSRSPFGGAVPPGGMPLNPFLNPFGGVAPDEEIDGISAKELAIFVGRSTHYYLPCFKALSSHGGKRLNWSAFLFQGYYFLYRKMYGVGLAAFFASFLLGLPSLYGAMVTLLGSQMPFLLPISDPALARLIQITGLVSAIFRFVLGLFSNSLYKRQVYRKINKLREQNLPAEVYQAALAKKGSVATKLMLVLLLFYFLAELLWIGSSLFSLPF